MSYQPSKIANRAVTEGDSPYTLPMGVVTTVKRGNTTAGAMQCVFPATPVTNATVTIKQLINSKAYRAAPITIVPQTGQPVEIPHTADDSTALTTSSFSWLGLGGSVRWVWSGAEWVVDTSYTSGRREPVIVTADYTIDDGDHVVVDTSLGVDITVTVPASLPDGARFVVNKLATDDYAALVVSGGSDQFQQPRIGSAVADALILIYGGESATYVKRGATWYLAGDAIASYYEIYGISAANLPIEITPGASLLPIELASVHSRSLLFDSNVGGLLTVTSLMTGDTSLSLSIQIVLEHNLTANNADVWSRIEPVVTPTPTGQIVVPIEASFAHSRSGIFGDNRSSQSLLRVSAGNTVGIYAEEIAAVSGSTDITGIIAVFEL